MGYNNYMKRLSSEFTARTHPLYNVWASMKYRCSNPNNPAYKYYGGRGITFSEEFSTFIGFIQAVGKRPPGTTLDRIDNDGDYCLENVRWVTMEEQNKNKRAYKRHKQCQPVKRGNKWVVYYKMNCKTKYKSFDNEPDAVLFCKKLIEERL